MSDDSTRFLKIVPQGISHNEEIREDLFECLRLATNWAKTVDVPRGILVIAIGGDSYKFIRGKETNRHELIGMMEEIKHYLLVERQEEESEGDEPG